MAYSAFGINYDTAAKISAYAGDAETPAQPIWAEDTHQLWIVDGTNGKYRIAMADELTAVLTKAEASSTYLTQANAASTYLTKATADGAYLGKTEKAASAASADVVQWGGVQGAPSFMPAVGDAGQVAMYCRQGTAPVTAVTKDTPDFADVNTTTLTLEGLSGDGISYVKILQLKVANVTIPNLNGWTWKGGSAPTIKAGDTLIACRAGAIGFLQVI